MSKAIGFLGKHPLLHFTRRYGSTPDPMRSRLGWRSASTQVRNSKRRSGLLAASGGVLLGFGLLSPFYYVGRIQPDSGSEPQSTPKYDDISLGALTRSYAVYTMCSIPALVDYSPRLLELGNLPGLKWITDAFVRITFFNHFVGGDTAQKAVPLLRSLRAANKGALFAYSVEVDEAEATAFAHSNTKHKGPPPHKRIVDEMIHCIDVAADFEDSYGDKPSGGRKTWVAIKLTALIPNANALIRLSSYLLANRPSTSLRIPFPGCPHKTDLDILYKPVKGANPLTEEDIVLLRDLHADLERICTRGQERGVKVIIDAEYSWYQPALDAFTLSLMNKFNKLPSRGQLDSRKVQPLVYGTYQAYLRRTPTHLTAALADAKAHNYALGVKLVRGAYHPHELSAHDTRGQSLSISSDPEPPVWTNKSDTDACYNACAEMLVSAIKADVGLKERKDTNALPSVGVLFGTHNWESCRLILDDLVKAGLARRGPGGEDLVNLGDEVTERLTIGQLYGMSDDLTDFMVSKTRSPTPLIIKYIPYGALSEVMPYLSRRAIENKSVLGEGIAAKERRRAGAEIRKRLFGF